MSLWPEKKKVSVCYEFILIAVWEKQLRYVRDLICLFSFIQVLFKVTVVYFLFSLFTFFHSTTHFSWPLSVFLSFPSAFMLAFQYVGRTNSERVSASLNVVTCLPSSHLLLHLPFFPISPFFIPLASASDSRVRDIHTLNISVNYNQKCGAYSWQHVRQRQFIIRGFPSSLSDWLKQDSFSKANLCLCCGIWDSLGGSKGTKSAVFEKIIALR